MQPVHGDDGELHGCRVTESLGSKHDQDWCEPACSQEHALFFVSVASDSSPPKARNRMLDLKLDLHMRCNVSDPRMLMPLDPTALQVCVPVVDN